MAQQAAPLSVPYSIAPQRPLLRRLFGRDWKIAFVFIAPVVILMVFFIAWPFVKALYTSMTIHNLTTRSDVFVGFRNYANLYKDPFYQQTVWATIVFTVG